MARKQSTKKKMPTNTVKKSNKSASRSGDKSTKPRKSMKPRIRVKAVRPIHSDVVVITGMSGAGRTLAMRTFEDLGYYVIDNLPPEMLLQLVDIVGINSGISRHLAVVCDLRTQGLLDALTDVLDELHRKEITTSLIYLDASDDILRERYLLSRRKNPIAHKGEAMLDAIARERKHLRRLKKAADEVIDTSQLKPMEFKRHLEGLFSELSAQELMEVDVFSFGYKWGMPVEADLMIDVRFLPNPYWDESMRYLTGQDPAVRDFVLNKRQTKSFLKAWFNLLDKTLPGYVREGKAKLSIAVGCTGGQHRSVVLAAKTAEHLIEAGYSVNLAHRDIERAKLLAETPKKSIGN